MRLRKARGQNHDPSSVSTASIACRQSPISRVSVACAAGWHGAHCPFHLSCFAPLMLHTRPRGTVLLERISQMKGSMAEDDCYRRCSSCSSAQMTKPQCRSAKFAAHHMAPLHGRTGGSCRNSTHGNLYSRTLRSEERLVAEKGVKIH